MSKHHEVPDAKDGHVCTTGRGAGVGMGLVDSGKHYGLLLSGKEKFEHHSFVRNDFEDDFAWPKSTFFDVVGQHLY